MPLPTTVSEYLARHTVPAQKGRKCIDGRYASHEAPGKIARPGADLGYVLALLALKKEKNLSWTPTQCFDMVFNAVSSMGEQFCMHTDEHANPAHHDAPPIGCGHVAKATIYPEMYGVDAEEVKAMISYALEKAATDPTIENINLHGDHKESGILAVSTPSTTVLPQDEKTSDMFFVYDKIRDEEFTKKLFVSLNITEFTYEEFVQTLGKQMQATVGLLAKGKPVYEV